MFLTIAALAALTYIATIVVASVKVRRHILMWEASSVARATAGTNPDAHEWTLRYFETHAEAARQKAERLQFVLPAGVGFPVRLLAFAWTFAATRRLRAYEASVSL